MCWQVWYSKCCLFRIQKATAQKLQDLKMNFQVFIQWDFHTNTVGWGKIKTKNTPQLSQRYSYIPITKAPICTFPRPHLQFGYLCYTFNCLRPINECYNLESTKKNLKAKYICYGGSRHIQHCYQTVCRPQRHFWSYQISTSHMLSFGWVGVCQK